MKKVSLLVTLLSSLAAMVAAPESAHAQEWLVAARASVAGGIDVGGAEVAMRRARSVVSLGADLAVDERPKDIFGAAVIVEVEPKASFGGAARYGRLLGPSSLIFLSGEGLVAPHTLFGAGGGFEQRFAFSKTTQLTLGPSFNVFFIGQDIPDDSVFWRALLAVGFRADL
ncbi:MAG: hypothetical protein IPG50_37765 [Myxococcales bacterium]|nr:hypothetical protein [Myxococcales bacterium]